MWFHPDSQISLRFSSRPDAVLRAYSLLSIPNSSENGQRLQKLPLKPSIALDERRIAAPRLIRYGTASRHRWCGSWKARPHSTQELASPRCGALQSGFAIEGVIVRLQSSVLFGDRLQGAGRGLRELLDACVQKFGGNLVQVDA
jgi:hypothetical protein